MIYIIKQEGSYQNKVNSSLVCTCICKIGYWSRIDLVTVFGAILTSRQTREKLQRLYENLMSNNFRRMGVLKNI